MEREFTITKDPVNISGAKISAIPDQEFAKKNITPAVNVTYGGKTLVQELITRFHTSITIMLELPQ